jgi:hypothetical protein
MHIYLCVCRHARSHLVGHLTNPLVVRVSRALCLTRASSHIRMCVPTCPRHTRVPDKTRLVGSLNALCLTKIHLIGTMSLGVPTCRVLSGTLARHIGWNLGQTHWLESWTSQISLSGIPTCCVLFSVIYVWPHLVCVPDTSESCQSWYLLLSMSLGVPTCMTCSQTQQQWCGLLCWHYGWNQCSWWWCWSHVVYTCGGVCLAVSKSISLGVLCVWQWVNPFR